MAKLLKLAVSGTIVNLVRLARLFPNNDPIIASMMPFSRKENMVYPFLYAFLIMFSFDAITGKVGIWTVVTAVTYGAVGILANVFFKRFHKISLLKYVYFTVAGTLFFDLITGPIMSSAMFNIGFIESFYGQMPFTAMHLLSGVFYTIAFCPALDPEVDQRYNVARRMTDLYYYITQKIAGLARGR